jgi:glucose-1-phosphate thymidylyltransferase
MHSNKRGIILAGGLGTRLSPITDTCNKHTIHIAGRAMIEYPIARLVAEGVREIAICLNGPFGNQVESVVGNGNHLGCTVQYFYADVVRGPGKSLEEAREWGSKSAEDIVVLFGDGIFFHPLNLSKVTGPHMFLMDLPPGGADGPEKYAQARIEKGIIIELIEKPKVLISTLVQAGAFVFPSNVFAIISSIDAQTPRDKEIGITEINQWYIRSNHGLKFSIISQDSYIDCGTPEALHEAETRVYATQKAGSSIF